MKRLTLLLFSLFCFGLTHAQTRPPVDPEKDKMQVGEYTIVLINALGETYGYEVRKGIHLVVRQKDNPIVPYTKGLFTKQDAFNLAQWVINQYKETGKLPLSYPPTLYQELNLTPEQ